MNRTSSLALVLAAVLGLAACDRGSPDVAPPATSAPGASTAPSLVPATPAPSPAATVSPTATAPILAPTRGEARPPGRYLVRRGDGVWLVSFTGSEAERRLYTPPSGATWGVVGVGEARVYVAETVGFSTSVLDVDIGGRALSIFGPDSTVVGQSERHSSVSPDGRFIAYVAEDGLRLRDLRSRADRLLGRNLRWRLDDCVIVTTCVGFTGASWSDTGRYAVGTGISYEPVVTWLFDVAPGSTGMRVPGCSMNVWHADRVLVNDGDCYSRAGPRAFWYDPGTAQRTEVPPPAGRDCFPWGAAVRADGVLSVNWEACLPSGRSSEERYTRRADARRVLVIYDADGRALVEREYSGADDAAYLPVAWVVDGTGVIVRQWRDGPFRFLDLQGELWTLNLDAVSLLAAVPDP